MSMREMSKRTMIAIAAGVAVLGGGAGAAGTALAGNDKPAATVSTPSAATPHQTKDGNAADDHSDELKKLPSGTSTATSFWDPETASGRPMAYRTLASPYWPLGTKVRITYQGKSQVGVVDDFGPAEWAVAQHNPPALVDLSEKMMKHFTGSRSDSIVVKFQVLKKGDGRVYRTSGTGYDTATKVK